MLNRTNLFFFCFFIFSFYFLTCKNKGYINELKKPTKSEVKIFVLPFDTGKNELKGAKTDPALLFTKKLQNRFSDEKYKYLNITIEYYDDPIDTKAIKEKGIAINEIITDADMIISRIPKIKDSHLDYKIKYEISNRWIKIDSYNNPNRPYFANPFDLKEDTIVGTLDDLSFFIEGNIANRVGYDKMASKIMDSLEKKGVTNYSLYNELIDLNSEEYTYEISNRYHYKQILEAKKTKSSYKIYRANIYRIYNYYSRIKSFSETKIMNAARAIEEIKHLNRKIFATDSCQLGESFRILGYFYAKQKNRDSSYYYYQEAIDYCKFCDNCKENTFTNLAFFYSKDSIDVALDIIEKKKVLQSKYKNLSRYENHILEVNNLIDKSYIESRNNTRGSSKYLKQALKIVQKSDFSEKSYIPIILKRTDIRDYFGIKSIDTDLKLLEYYKNYEAHSANEYIAALQDVALRVQLADPKLAWPYFEELVSKLELNINKVNPKKIIDIYSQAAENRNRIRRRGENKNILRINESLELELLNRALVIAKKYKIQEKEISQKIETLKKIRH